MKECDNSLRVAVWRRTERAVEGDPSKLGAEDQRGTKGEKAPS